jgi:serine-type D-Ala-D-Ala carboxypeptidase (penicillin-binding protein 5/6)
MVSLSRLRNAPFIGAFLVLIALARPAPAADAGFETAAKQAILIDMTTDTVLFAKDPDGPMHPASLTKLMTMYIVFQRLKNGSLKLDDTLPVSVKAWKTGGSKMFVQVNTRVKVADLIQGVIVQSGNDACIVLAEGLAGSVDSFAAEMNKTAKVIGLAHSSFKNPDGLPVDGHIMTARDVAALSEHIIRDFPEYYHYFKELNFTYNGIKQGNRNPLLYKDLGVDGLKTGHTDEAGYSLAATALRDGRRLLVVVGGLPSVNARSQEGERLLDWGYREFATYALFKGGETVDQVPVWLGKAATVPLQIKEPVVVTMRKKLRPDMKVVVRYTGPVPAPIVAGAALGTLTVSAPGWDGLERKLVAGDGVARLGVFGRLSAAVHHVIWGSPG